VVAATPEEQAAVAAFQAPLTRVLRDLAGLLGLGRRDIPLARAALVLFGIAAFRAGRTYEKARQPPQERPTVRRPAGKRGASGVMRTPVAPRQGWPEGENTPLADDAYPSQAEGNLSEDTSPGYPNAKRESPTKKPPF
jgi:hypothetical protein